MILKRYLRNKYMIEVACNQIGSHLRLPHPKGIILCAESIGSNCLIGQFVTIGGNNCKKRVENNKDIYLPTIGDNVQISAGSVIGGPCIIGNNIVIGANTTITHDVPSNTLIYNQTTVSKRKVIVPGYKAPFYYYERIEDINHYSIL